MSITRSVPRQRRGYKDHTVRVKSVPTLAEAGGLPYAGSAAVVTDRAAALGLRPAAPDRDADLARAEQLMDDLRLGNVRLDNERYLAAEKRMSLDDRSELIAQMSADQNEAATLRNRHGWVDPRVLGRTRKDNRESAMGLYASTATLEYAAANDRDDRLRDTARQLLDYNQERRERDAGPSVWDGESPTEQRLHAAGSAYASDATLADSAQDPDPEVRQRAAWTVADRLKMYRP